MAEFNRNQNGVFGEIKFKGNGNETENTSFFESTIAGSGISGVNNQNQGTQKENAGGIFGSFKTSGENLGSNGNSGNNFGTSNGNSGWDLNNNGENFQPIGKDKAITKQGLWSKVKAFLFQEIDLKSPLKVELTPYQQKVEDEINEFLHQEISFKGIANLFKGKK